MYVPLRFRSTFLSSTVAVYGHCFKSVGLLVLSVALLVLSVALLVLSVLVSVGLLVLSVAAPLYLAVFDCDGVY